MMKWIPRFYESTSNRFFQKGKIVILFGARRVGKTALVRRLLTKRKEKLFSGTGEDMELAGILSDRRIGTYKLFFAPYETIFIDEAQYIPDGGLCLKMLVDLFPDKHFLITGSSSFHNAQSASYPLTGRSVTRILYPLALVELRETLEPFEIYSQIESYLIYGMYPEILTQNGVQGKIEYLINLRNSYLLKDIFSLEQVRNSQKLQDILRLLALQIGNQVSLHEIANHVGISKNTVERYLDLFEKAFIIKKVPAFSRNLRNEVSKSAKYYFWDTGVRNAVINNFNRLELRNDVGALWENFVVMELIKKSEYTEQYAQFYFWRTYDRKELDLVVEYGGKLTAYEIKWGKQTVKSPLLWQETYGGTVEVITRERLLEVL
jgi:predicted AAA+ superfamily ATPase